MKKMSNVELDLREDPNNPLNKYRRQCDIDQMFFRKYWYLRDIFNEQKSDKDLDTIDRFVDIITGNPDIFTKGSDCTLTLEEKRIQTHKQLVYYAKRASEIMPMREVLSDLTKYTMMACPIAFFKEDIGVKLTVNL